MALMRLRPRDPGLLHDGPRPQGLFEQRRSQISRGADLLRAQHGAATHRRHEAARLETHARDEHVGRKWQREHFQGRVRRFFAPAPPFTDAGLLHPEIGAGTGVRHDVQLGED